MSKVVPLWIESGGHNYFYFIYRLEGALLVGIEKSDEISVGKPYVLEVEDHKMAKQFELARLGYILRHPKRFRVPKGLVKEIKQRIALQSL